MEAPNVFIYEIDQTGGSTEVLGATTGLVGMTGKGPAFRPTSVSTINQFKTYFGDSEQSKYLYFASKFFLENNKPITVVRPLGVNSDDGTFHAGFNDVADIVTLRLSGSDAPVLATIWIKDQVEVTITNANAKTIYENFTLTITRNDENDAPVTMFSGDVNFDPASINYISKKINTDYLKFHDNGYVLTQVNGFAYHPGTDGILPSPLSSVSALDYLVSSTLSDSAPVAFNVDYTTPKTPWVISQFFGEDVDGDPIYHKLFRVYSISDGEWANNGIKVYVSGIRKSNSTDTSYGTFDIIVRDYTDTDASQKILEKFSGCSLNPKDKNYILKKIGDKYTTYDFDNEKLISHGDYDNKSSYIYIELSADIKNAPQDSLPWGFMNVPTIGNDTEYPMPHITKQQAIKGLYTPKKMWGVCFEKPNSDISTVAFKHDESLDNLFNYIPSNINGVLGEDTQVVFSLNAIDQTDAGDEVRGTSRLRNALLKKLQFNSTLLTSVATTWASVEALEGTTAANFGMPLFGGFDALNPFFESPAYAFDVSGEKYSFLGMFNDGTSLPTYTTPSGDDWADTVDQPTGNTEEENPIVYIFNKAINLITDPVLINIQTLACPGITNDVINVHGIQKCEERGDTLFVTEICENGTTKDECISYKESIGYDTSYSAAYFPYYKIYDAEQDKYSWIPPSIAALKAYSLTDKISFPWYASAGLLRGSMPEAVDVAYKSSTPERTDLANAYINPIASFPGEGNVIWGQNTLYSKNGSYFQMLHVRRLTIYAKKAVKSAALNFVFEPNAQKTWDSFVKRVTPIFSYIQAFQGLANFKITCDETLNTQDLINQRKMMAQIIIQPIPDAEIIEIPFIVTDNGVIFGE